MSYLRYLCLLACSGVQTHIVLYFCFGFFSSCVSYFASFSGLFFFDIQQHDVNAFFLNPSVFSNVYLLFTPSHVNQ